MAVVHDHECENCGKSFEAFVAWDEREIECPRCNGRAVRVFKHFGGMLGKNKGKYPYFDVQLGTNVESSQHRDRIAKERGLEVMGNQEWERSRHAPRTPDPLDSDEPDPQLIEIAKRAWDDVKFDRVPKEVEEERVLETIKRDSTVMADDLKPKED